MHAGLPSYLVLTPSVSARAPAQEPGTQSHKLTLSACKLWDPVGGTVAPLTAAACGLFDVWLVYNANNIWGNLQRACALHQLNWNLTDARCWMPLWGDSEDDQAASKLPTVQEDADYAALQQYQHGEDVLHFQSLSGLVFDQLAARVERIAKEFLGAEREALGLKSPAWRYALSQDLKEKLLKTAADDCIVELLEGHAREVSGEDVNTAAGPGAGGPRRSGGVVVAMHERHEAQLSMHKDGRGIVGYLLKLPFGDQLLAQEQGEGKAGGVEVWPAGLCAAYW